MNKKKSKNNFSQYVSKGDWLGYKNEVSKQNNSLYRELGKKVPPLAKLDKLLLSTSRYKRIMGELILVIIYLLLLSPWFYLEYVKNHQIAQILLTLIPTLIIHSLMTCVLVARDKSFTRLDVLLYFLFKMIEILLKHFSYIIRIFLKNNKSVFSIVATSFNPVWAISGLNIFIVHGFYNVMKHYEFENIHTWPTILIPFALIIAGGNVWILKKLLDQKCDTCGKAINNWNSEVNSKLTIAVCFFLSFVNVFALLRENHDSDYIRVIFIVVVVFVFLFEKLLFGNNNQK
jgi:hypothetical protein